MLREAIGTGKTTEEAIAAACAELGVDSEDLNVSTEILELPVKKLFRTLPARVKVTVEEPDPEPVPTPAPEPAPAAEPVAEEAPEAPAEDTAPAAEPAPETAPAPQAEEDDTEREIDPEAEPKVKAAMEYLIDVFAAMGVTDVKFTAVEKGGATILRVEGRNVGALIGRRGETMESLSYLASLVANRLGGDYIKLGLDVAGYRGKRESDLEALAKRISEKVVRTGHCYAIEPMNPYERRIIHSAVGKLEGVRSESAGDGPSRHVVIYSTDPNASNLPDRSAERRPRRDGGRPRPGSRPGSRPPRREGSRDGSRDGQRRDGGRRYPPKNGERRGPRPSSVPERNFKEVAPGEAAPVAPTRPERINDADGFALYGKIEL